MKEKIYYFDHEKLIVYQKSLEFLKWLNVVLTKVEKRYSVYEQLERASTSIILNISEGNGKFTSKDRCRYFDISRGSALECSAGLDILVTKDILTSEEIKFGKDLLKEIVSMLIGLIKSNSERIHEPEVEYNSDR